MTLDEIRAYAHADALQQMSDGKQAPETVIGVINRALRTPWTHGTGGEPDGVPRLVDEVTAT